MANYLNVRDALMTREFAVAMPNPVLDQAAWKPTSEVLIGMNGLRSILLVIVDLPYISPIPAPTFPDNVAPLTLPELPEPKVIVETQMGPQKKSFRFTFEEFLEALEAGVPSTSHTDYPQSSAVPSSPTPLVQ